ncbi:MAG: DUF2237 family protein, partial [Candidatus Puniceispirillaceae bacterium]
MMGLPIIEKGHKNMDGSGGRPQRQLNVLGGPLESCSHNPVTGFFRDG